MALWLEAPGLQTVERAASWALDGQLPIVGFCQFFPALSASDGFHALRSCVAFAPLCAQHGASAKRRLSLRAVAPLCVGAQTGVAPSSLNHFLQLLILRAWLVRLRLGATAQYPAQKRAYGRVLFF